MRLPELNTRSAFEFYESVVSRLPETKDDSIHTTRHAQNLLDIAEHFDAFVFDAFGVLNVGHTAIPGTAACIAQLRALDKRVLVMTNGASLNASATMDKYHSYGFDFAASEIISSRAVALAAITEATDHWTTSTLWGAITGGRSSLADLPVDAIALDKTTADFDRVEAILFLSSSGWSGALQNCLLDSLRRKPRPVVVANPDVVAPKEKGYTLEPGYFAHSILNQLQSESITVPVFFYGKPYPDIYALAAAKLDSCVSRQRIAMVGDTLHTDVLGAKYFGWQSVLVTQHGLFRGHNVADYVQSSGIKPDWIIPCIENNSTIK